MKYHSEIGVVLHFHKRNAYEAQNCMSADTCIKLMALNSSFGQ